MKRLLFICCMFCSMIVFGQFTDDFTDGDFTNNPVWSGDNSKFIITDGQLNSQNVEAATYYISTPSTISTMAVWEFFINLKFSTSGANLVDVYLMSDNADLTLAMNGYFVRIGNTKDEISFYKIASGVETMIIDGADGTVNTSSNNPFNIRVSRDESNLWRLEIDDGAVGTYVSEGSVTDNDVNTSAYFGVKIKQSSANSPKNNHFFDNFSVIAIIPDTQAPTISTLSVISNTEIDVKFDEAVDQTTSEMVSNYTVDNGIGQPMLAVLDQVDHSLVHLTFSLSFSNTNYQVTIQNVEDVNGNTIINEVENFTVLIPELAAIEDIVISEIMADPTPKVGLPNSEYIEIYNRSSKNIDLANYTLSDRIITLNMRIMSPNEYVILCNEDNIALFQSLGTVIGLPSWNALNDGGERITLMDKNNALIIDELTYDISWHNNDTDKADGGWSLERINPDHLCSDENNWSSSNDTLGGTPGTQNSVFDNTPDLTGPELSSVIAIATNSLKLTFNERLDIANLASAVFTLSPVVAIDTIYATADLQTIIIVFSETLQKSINYIVSVEGLNDCSGNVIGDDQSGAFLLTSPVADNDIIISEIMADPSPEVELPEAEYVELYNRSDKYINLINYTIDGKVITSKDKIFAPKEYVIICDNGDVDLFDAYGDVLGVVSWSTLTNAGKTIALADANSQLVDEVNYNNSWYNSIDKADGGWSLELIDPENLCGEESNWSASTDQNGGTPGKINSINGDKPDLSGPSLLSTIAISPDSLILKFNEKLETTSFSSVKYTFEPNLTIEQTTLSSDFREITIVLSSLLEASKAYQMTITNLKDCNGNLIRGNNTQIFALSEVAVKGDLLINELLYNPIASEGDFLEIYNHSTKQIDLKGWMIANGSDELPENMKIISEDHLLISPQQYLVFSQEIQSVLADYPRGIAANFVELQSLPSFPNNEQGVVLLNPAEIVFDYFPYEDDMQHALLDDTKGVSLERISFDSPTIDPNNWHSASKTEGYATPGYFNSQSLKAPINTTDDILISPQVFLPNQSGQDDFATISYSFNQAGFVATVTVLDVNGRVIKSIAQNQLLGSKGFFQWDGTMDIGRKARAGAYIVLFEIFDLSGNQKSYKKRVVIALAR